MGLEVRYRGRIKDIDCVEHFERQAVRMAATLQGWSVLWNPPDSPDPSLIRGATLQLLPSQPLVSMLISPAGELISLQTAENCENHASPDTPNWCSTCTEASGQAGHCLLLTLLTVLQHYWFPNLEVEDSSGQWPHIPDTPLQAKLHSLIRNELQTPTFDECLITMQPDDSRHCCDCDDEDHEETPDAWSIADITDFQAADTSDTHFVEDDHDAHSADFADQQNDDGQSATSTSESTSKESLRTHVRTLHDWARHSRCIFNTMFDPDEAVALRSLLMMVHHCGCTEEILPFRNIPDMAVQLHHHLQRILWFASSMQFAVIRMTSNQRLTLPIAATGQTELQLLSHKVQLLLHLL
ncbi:hypothetical protein LBMAG46_37420 [Planctomycetia bacterium]|nr:hypothetical protein LBMAG46_37420 [Planctomycetia bacterium]